MLRDQTQLRFKQVMDLRRLALPPLTRHAERELRHAAQRCLTCRSKTRCDLMLEAKHTEELRLFCPNTGYIERLRRGGVDVR